MVKQPHPTWTPNKRAERILFDTYWSSHAKEAGYLFDSITLSHDEVLDHLLRLRLRLDPTMVARAFSDSLTNRRLDLRSALGSYGANLYLQKHDFVGSRTSTPTRCDICECHIGEPENLSILNFERFKWGGVRHQNPAYALFDLSQFMVADRGGHPESREPLLRILDLAANATADCRPSDLVKLIGPLVPGNVDQRRVVIGCLGYAGILQPISHPGFFDGYPTNRDSPGGKNDWPYPVSWWRGRDGVNSAALAFYFPDL